ncbi:hypothetical protein [Embleya sp. NPDC001921]
MTDRTPTLTDAGAEVLRLRNELAAAYRSILGLTWSGWDQIEPTVRQAALTYLAAGVAFADERNKPVHEYEPSAIGFTCTCGSHLFARCHGGALPD